MNYKACIGIDCGSTACKGALYCEGKFKYDIIPTGWSPKNSAKDIVNKLILDTNLNEDEIYIVTTGYGRSSVDFEDFSLTEISCHSIGGDYLLKGVKTIVDIGGQDLKAISILNGKVIDFQMNDKCAAGTGRFVEMLCMKLSIDLNDLNELLKMGGTCQINSMCVVFAESEIISLLAEGVSRSQIANGVMDSIAKKVASLIAKVKIEEPVLITGGLYHVEVLREKISKQIGVKLEYSEYSQMAGAIGAALKGYENILKLRN